MKFASRWTFAWMQNKEIVAGIAQIIEPKSKWILNFEHLGYPYRRNCHHKACWKPSRKKENTQFLVKKSKICSWVKRIDLVLELSVRIMTFLYDFLYTCLLYFRCPDNNNSEEIDNQMIYYYFITFSFHLLILNRRKADLTTAVKIKSLILKSQFPVFFFSSKISSIFLCFLFFIEMNDNSANDFYCIVCHIL